MSRFNAAFILPVLLGLAACQSGVPDTAVTEGQRQSQACGARLEANPDYAGIARHMPLGGEPATAAQQTDFGVPHAADRAALVAWRADLTRCRQPAIDAVEVFAPDAVPVLRRNYGRSDAAIDALVQGRSSWAEANRTRDALVIASAKALWPAGGVRMAVVAPATEPAVTVARRQPHEAVAPKPVSLASAGQGADL
jgi:hypothetical protein